MPAISNDQLQRLALDDITQSTSALLVEPHRLLKKLSGGSFERQELQLLDLLPRKLGFYYLVFRLDALWANGGMQAVALDKDSEASARLLNRTIEAFEFFGASSGTAILREVVPVAIKAAGEINALVKRDAADDAFEPVWARLDAYDDRHEDAFAEIYSLILSDIHSHPADWQTAEFRFCKPKYQWIWSSLIFFGCVLTVGVRYAFPKAPDWIGALGILTACIRLIVLGFGTVAARREHQAKPPTEMK